MNVQSDATTTVVDSAKRGRSRRFLRLVRGFWSGNARRQAWLHTSAIAFFLLANIVAALGLNWWNKYFFDAIEQKNTQARGVGVYLIAAIAILSAAASVGLLHARTRMQLRWRQWLTDTLITRWLADRHFYQLTVIHADAENPEARIAEDGRIAI